MSVHTPGPWKVGYAGLDVGCKSARDGGYTKLFDVRGWGYLTGTGHGALGLGESEAVAIQTANANLISAAPDYYAAAENLIRIAEAGVIQNHEEWGRAMKALRAAHAKAAAT